MQAVLLTTSLLLVLAMIGSLVWLTALRPSPEGEAIPVNPADDTV